jgi:hypothetical protein
MKQLDDFRRIAALICLGSGGWWLVTGIQIGAWWRTVVGFVFIVIGFVIAYHLRRKSNRIGGW